MQESISFLTEGEVFAAVAMLVCGFVVGYQTRADLARRWRQAR
jgi:hypothetical protein